MLKSNFKKLVLILAIALFSTGSLTLTHAAVDNNLPCTDNTYLKTAEGLRNCRDACKDSDFKLYTSSTCTEILLGVKELDTGKLFIKQNPSNFIIVIIQFLLAVVVVIVVFRILGGGFTVTSAGADKEKQLEGFKKVFNAVIGLVLSFSSLGITNIVKNIFLSDDPEKLLRECADLIAENADPEVIKDCELLQDPT